MKALLLLILIAFPFGSYYSIGDTVLTIHQEELFDVCYGDYPHEQLKLAHFSGKISIFGLSASW